MRCYATTFAVLIADREADPLRGQDDRGVHADDLRGGVDEGASGVPGVQRGIGLDDVVDEPARARSKGPAQRAHHTRGHGVLEPVRVADGDRDLTDAERSRSRPASATRSSGEDPDDGQIGIGIIADDPRLDAPPVRQRRRRSARRRGPRGCSSG